LHSNLSLVRISCSVLIDFIRNYLEGTFVTPSVVPGVVDQPVVLAVFSALADDFGGVTAQRTPGFVRVDSALVGQEVCLDSEGHCD